MRDAEERHSGWEDDYAKAERAQDDNWAIAYGYNDIDEWQADQEQIMEDIIANAAAYEESFIKFAEADADEQYAQEAAYLEQWRNDTGAHEREYDELKNKLYEDEANRESEGNQPAAQREGASVEKKPDTGAVQRGNEEGSGMVQGEQGISPEGRGRGTDEASRPHAGTSSRHVRDAALVKGAGEGEVGPPFLSCMRLPYKKASVKRASRPALKRTLIAETLQSY